MKAIWKYRFFPFMAITMLFQYYDYYTTSSFLFILTLMDLARVYKPK